MSNNFGLMDLLFPATRQRALAQLLLKPGQTFHLRELARLTNTHAGTLGRELDRLSQAGLLTRSQQGNQVRYQANPGCPVFEDLASLFRKTHGTVPALQGALAALGNRVELAILFGSVARGTQNEGSDIDVLVVGAVGFSELVRGLYPIHETLQREISPVLYSPEEFRERSRRADPFLGRVLAQPHVFLIGGKDDLAKLAGDPSPADLYA
ncbi:nucleotidyltransferase domain-containing protein [Frateuria sp. GZRR35]|uniref:nucleotidyltransferase domain-containing protein n=1 Tax=Frateuria sp. GZRR35 TaxID=3351536 RepID=UPI003EDC7C0F